MLRRQAVGLQAAELVADGETHHLDVEVFALSRQTEYGGVSF